MDTLLSVFVGVGLSAACGFRVFLPLLVMSIASLTGQMTLSPEFEWIATYPALAAFAIATIFEIGAYYIPWVDNLLDTVAIPAATVAGTIVMASAVSEMSPFLKWGLAIIVGGGVAGTVQGFTTITRIASTAATGGLGNPLVSTAEAGGSLVMSILAIAVPVLAAIGAAAIIFIAWRKIYTWFARRNRLQPRHE
ncbi:MAG: hypothetical protein A3J42_02715 [Candidatus Dadabacteria bacterium RIFCSPHIGHO2_12_FULL_53_21]|nr:MAG: hypothetical protein A3J42_02715 [Candidatus Dadabacteria bacterium RIFCSPHIGHO2_12_FULL_53_21]